MYGATSAAGTAKYSETSAAAITTGATRGGDASSSVRPRYAPATTKARAPAQVARYFRHPRQKMAAGTRMTRARGRMATTR